MDDDKLSPEDVELLESFSLGHPKEEEKMGIFAFFKKVITMEDTARTSNLNIDELGLCHLPVRTLKELSLFCNETGLKGLGRVFNDEAGIITNTSLSKEGFLDKLVVTQRKATETRMREFSEKQKRSWFKKRDSDGEMI